MEALHYGVPLVTVPQMPKQETNADRVTELRLDTRLDATALAANRLRATVDGIATEARIRARVDAMSAAARAAGGTQRAADELLAHAS